MFDVITVGSATVDAFALTDRKYFKNNKYSFPVGAKILIKELNFSVGGGGTNTAVSFSRLGLKTAFLGKVGTGGNSKRVLGLLKKEKVNTSLVCRGKSRTGYSIVLDAAGHDRTILVFKGSNDNLRFDEIRKRKLKTKWFYFSSMMNESFDTQKRLAVFAKENGIKVAYNPSEYLTKKGLNYLRPIIRNSDIFICNMQEAGNLVKAGDVKKKLQKLRDAGPRIVIITDGAKAVHALADCHYKAIPSNVKVVETTGAGDAFSSAFVAAIIKGKSIDFALTLGIANAESVIQHFGAKENLLREDEIVKLLRNKEIKVLKHQNSTHKKLQGNFCARNL